MSAKNKITIIEPPSRWVRIDFKEIWRYRGLLWALTYRDIKVRYSQTFLGVLWALINPLASLFILWFVFDKVAKLDNGPVPPILFIMAGITCWSFFANLVSEAGQVILSHQSMIQKVYFPRLFLPLSKVMTGLIDLGINLSLLLSFMLWYGYTPSAHIVLLPVFILIAIVAGLAGGIWISALTIRYRDIRFVVPFAVRIGMYASPVAYASALHVPEAYQFWYALNPMVGVIEGFRWALFGQGSFDSVWWLSLAIVGVLFATSLIFFNKVQGIIADIL